MNDMRSAADHFFQGLHALNRGDLKGAERSLLEALKIVPDRPSVLANLSIVYTKQNRLHEAAELAGAAIRNDPKDALLWLQLGSVQLKLERYDEALRSLEAAIQLDGAIAEAHNNLGAVLHALNRTEDAVANFDKAVSLKPDYAEAYSNRGNALKDLQRLEEALASYEKAIKLKPDYAEVHSNRGNALVQLRRPDEALASFAKAIGLNPYYAEAFSNRGNALKDLDRLEDAVASYDRAIQIKPDYADAYNNRGNALKELEKLDEAIASYDKAISLKPDYAEAYSNRGYALAQLGRIDEARLGHERAIDLKPDHAPAWVGLAHIDNASGRFEDAEIKYSRARTIDPTSVVALCGLAGVRKYSSDDPLIDEFHQRLSGGDLSDGERSWLHHSYAKICNDLGLYDDAVEQFARGKKLLARDFNISKHKAGYAALKQLFTRDFFASRVGFGLSDERPVFIVGMPRSGTTLTEQILASHPLVSGLGELPNMPRIAGSIGDGLRDPSRFVAGVANLRPDDVIRLGEIYRKAYEGCDPASIRLIDKMPHNFQWLGLIALLFPNARVIHCRRSPLDTCVSIYMQTYLEKHDYAKDLKTLGEYYREYESLMMHWRDVLPIQMHDCVYEDTISSFEPSVEAMLAFLGLAWDPNCLNYHQHGRQVKTASVWQVRQPIFDTSVERWRRYEKHIGPLKDALGID